MPSDEIVVAVLPNCDICITFQIDRKAYADCALGPGSPWAYVCEEHFHERNLKLGPGLGQRLILEGSS